MRKNNKFGESFVKISSEIIEVLYKIFRGIFVLVPVLWERFKRLFHFSLSFKISIVYSLLILISLMIFSFLVAGFFSVTTGKDTLESIEMSINDLNKYIEKNSLKTLQNDDEFLTISGKSILYVYNNEQSLIYKSKETAPDLEFSLPRDRFNIESTYIDDQILLSVTKAFYSHNQNYYISGAVNVKPFLTSLAFLGMFLFIVSLFFLVLLPAIGFKLSKNMLLPIKKMTQDAKEISLLNLDKRLDVSKSQDELKDLSLTFNEMLDRLQSSYEKQYQFISDASHELRTPISVIQGYANLLSRWGKEDRKILDESVDAIKNESQSMKDLIEKLLFIARTENKHEPLEKSIFNIEELLNEIIKDYKVFDTTHDFKVDAERNISMYADRKLIKQALRIFIDNAVKYTSEDGTVLLKTYVNKNKLHFIIKDNGIGISESDLPKIFDRFYRADTSRDKKSGGSGLGLAIAKIILDLHDGKIKVFSKINEGTEVQLIFDIKETIRKEKEQDL